MPNHTSNVPNRPRTPQRAVRVPDDPWFPAQDNAKRRGEKHGVSEIMRDSLAAFNLLTDEQWADLREVCEELGLTRPELFSTAITEFVERHKGKR